MRTQCSGLLFFDRVEERIDIVVFPADQPDDNAFVAFVLPRQHTLDRIAIDGDVFVVVLDGSDDSKLDLRLRWLIPQDVDEFADAHGVAFPVGLLLAVSETVAAQRPRTPKRRVVTQAHGFRLRRASRVPVRADKG